MYPEIPTVVVLDVALVHVLPRDGLPGDEVGRRRERETDGVARGRELLRRAAEPDGDVVVAVGNLPRA